MMRWFYKVFDLTERAEPIGTALGIGGFAIALILGIPTRNVDVLTTGLIIGSTGMLILASQLLMITLDIAKDIVLWMFRQWRNTRSITFFI